VVYYVWSQGTTGEVWPRAVRQEGVEGRDEVVGFNVNEQFRTLGGAATIYTEGAVGGGSEEQDGQEAE
jgi:hypothetical protein